MRRVCKTKGKINVPEHFTVGDNIFPTQVKVNNSENTLHVTSK